MIFLPPWHLLPRFAPKNIQNIQNILHALFGHAMSEIRRSCRSVLPGRTARTFPPAENFDSCRQCLKIFLIKVAHHFADRADPCIPCAHHQGAAFARWRNDEFAPIIQVLLFSPQTRFNQPGNNMVNCRRRDPFSRCKVAERAGAAKDQHRQGGKLGPANACLVINATHAAGQMYRRGIELKGNVVQGILVIRVC